MGKREPEHLGQSGAASIEFLKGWHGKAVGEIALRASYADASRSATEFVPLRAFKLIEKFIACHQAAKADVYFCPATCMPGAKLSSLAALPVLFAVFDSSQGFTEEVRRFSEFSLQPSACFALGSRVYIYWFLEKPIDLTSQEGRGRAQRLLAIICRELGGVLAVAKLDLFLPLPGAMTQELDPPGYAVLCGARFGERRRYALGLFEERLAGRHDEPGRPASNDAATGRKHAAGGNHNSESPMAKGNEPPAFQAMSEEPQERVRVQALIATLAELSKLDFELQRKEAAKAIGLRVSAIDQLVTDARAQAFAAAAEHPLWPEPVEGAALLEEIVSTIRKYVVLGPYESDAVALWILFAHCFEAASFPPASPPRRPRSAAEKRRY